MRWRAVLVVDLVVAVVAFVISAAILGGVQPEPQLRPPDAAAYGLLAVCSAAVVARRRFPVVAASAAVLAALVYAAAEYPQALTPVVLLPIYTAAAVLPQRRARMVLLVAVVGGILTATLGPGPTDLTVPALMVASWALGNYVGSRRAYTAELEDANRRLAQAQLDLADRAVAEERLRIARELHDVVAHTMSAVAMHAGTGRMVAERDPGAARESLATIETTTRSALLEMRQLLGVLRSSGEAGLGDRSPAPGLDDLDALVADVVRSGVTVEVRVDGERPQIPPGVDLSAYRIIQEALTNVLKHAGRVQATVAVRYAPDAVLIEVDDEGPPPGTGSATVAGGHGLVGMRERVALYDGELETGPRAGGGFHVAARLPLGSTP